MRNLKRALSLGMTAAMISSLMVVGSSAASYSDVTSDENQEAIEVLKEIGIMVGDDNGNFNPDSKVTRNEMAVVVSNLMAYNVATYKGTSPFTDVPSWAEPYVAACYTNGNIVGYTSTTYGGSDNVTTAQAALMLMKALGYFQYQSDFEDDWQLATTKQGNKIDLFDDVDTPVKDAITRNDLAQLVLNTLEAGTVEADSDVTKVESGDVKVETGSVKYNFITSAKDYAKAIDDKTSTNNDGSMSNGYIVELGEKLFDGDLTKEDDYDDFGRPASKWEYKSQEIGTYADDADYTYTAKVTSKQLYNDIGKTATGYDWNVSLNGESIDYDGADLSKYKNDDDTDFVAAALGDEYESTGNGVVTAVYVDSTEKTVDVAMIEYYAAEVLKVDEDDGTITLSDLTGNENAAKTTDEYDSTDFDEDDIVVYSYANDEIQEVYAATKLEGEVTRVRSKTTSGDETNGDNFVVDGTTYKYNKTTTKDRLTTDNVNNDVVAYMDANGYVVYIDESAITYDYAYVLSMGTDDDQYGTDGTNSKKGTSYYARLVLTDGTMVKVEVENTTGVASLNHHIVSYSKDKDGVYTLKDRSYAAISSANNLSVENGKSSFYTNQNYAANSNTIFIVAESDADSYDDYDFTVYTGIKNVPDIDPETSGTMAVVATETDSNVAKVVYIEDASTSGDDVIFLRADANAKLQKDSEIGNYYEISAYIDGAATTLNVKDGSSAATALVDKAKTNGMLTISSTKYIVAAKSITENSDGLVTSVRLYDAYNSNNTDGDGYFTGKGTEKAEKSTVGLLNQSTNKTSATKFAWDDEVEVTRYNENNKGEFATYRISSVKDDSNDTYLAVMDGDVIKGLCVIDVTGGSSTTDTTTTTNNKVTDNKDGTITYTVGNGQETPSMATIRNDVCKKLGVTFDSTNDTMKKASTTTSGYSATYNLTVGGMEYTINVDNSVNDEYSVTLKNDLATNYTVTGDTAGIAGETITFYMTQKTASDALNDKTWTIETETGKAPASYTAKTTTNGNAADTEDVYTVKSGVKAQNFSSLSLYYYDDAQEKYVVAEDYDANETYYEKTSKDVAAVKAVITVTMKLGANDVVITSMPEATTTK